MYVFVTVQTPFTPCSQQFIVAGGSSQRMGFDKLFAVIAGEPVIAHPIRAFERATSVDEIVVVARERQA